MERTKLICELGCIERNEQVGPALFVMTISSPQIAQSLLPGQFVHTRIPGMEAHILRRPFSVYATDISAGTMDILYQDLGFGSHHMSTLQPGIQLDNIGPIGAAWNTPETAQRVLFVGGGVGAAPLFMQVEEVLKRGIEAWVVLGGQTKDHLVTYDRFASTKATMVAATDDGSFGEPGFCTIPTKRLLDQGGFDQVMCCGPEPLMQAVSKLAADAHVPCQVSLERRMACGVGACLSCVVETPHGKKRACVDGPIFDAEEVIW